MISFHGYDDVIKRVYDNRQEHVFAFWEKLTDGQRKSLLMDLEDVDFPLLKHLYAQTESSAEKKYSPAPYIALPRTPEEKQDFAKAAERGIQAIKQGKVAAFIVAGGQGSRLGYEGPKGKFPTAPVSGKTLFELHGEKILANSIKYGVDIPWFVMTSHANHKETAAYFKEKNHFGLNPESVHIFPQNMIPSLDTGGRIILESQCSIFKNPDGHGGSLTALKSSGSLDIMKQKGIALISYFQVDNPLVNIIDPVFIGFHCEKGADISSKALPKAGAEEKVGVFVRYGNNTLGIVEYSDMPPEKIHETDEKGMLRYSSGNPAIHLFSREFIERITSSELSLPFHTARKKIASYTAEGTAEIEGYKFEKFVFDALSLTEKNVILEVVREEEFAPVKNASGPDSLQTCVALMDGLFRSWLTQRGIEVPPSVKTIEISSLFALGPEDIPPDLALPDKKAVYLERPVK
ncbi:MAG TPA: UDPGP type 1 family protein [Spirochaetota bacterium]|nr:UDPGP type 1 family protein [Spirochaetota bacterium]HPI87903.1 UDPGP type 1 family protein [Spirochaetota bacterium]HPR47365.1 UDPGP type 1 family protein [Spirochaetota bacterium]